ncbi:hypothetical protein [Photobacterium sanguinicancri]|uniref:DUF2799 domain-containing protein n=1 Tax=Photobacterium sanguinicancri TaxID=875932 RepID=A0ABX4FSE4_9GAMM|nr:hypothetical protein [Photobacterium sanguinicancri]OZS41812.1 hypothetical protein ASV53_21755 [Photobacterium sanguinicancri]
MHQSKFMWFASGMMVMLLVGCTNSSVNNIDTGLDNYQFLPDEYDVETEYNSIYFYGFNQGCRSKTYDSESGRLPVEIDSTLAKRSQKYNDGIEAGRKACEDGSPRTVSYYTTNK